MPFSPVNASKHIVEKYKRYLGTMFEISDENYSKQFIKEMGMESILSKGPYLDVTDSFVKGKTLNELIQEDKLAKGLRKLTFPLNRPLYKHQEKAIIDKVSNGKNVVVSTGTGSGKTECFLIPILNSLIREDEQGKLDPGVRALLIYPMNALANDQIERLRSILKDYPEITYGSYTGQTKQNYSDALAEYKKLNNDEIPIKNELISREQMKESPPHILITNYAMLEYLMIRPQDNVFFIEENSQKWKYIVLDESHVYNGSTGIEVSMLLRRLKAKLRNDKIQYILTSATLGGEDDNESVAEFATNLCNSKFYSNDVIRADRIKPQIQKDTYTLPIEFYNTISRMIAKDDIGEDIIYEIPRYTSVDIENSLEEILYDVILHDNTYWKIRENLENPKTVTSLANLTDLSTKDIEDFVTVASKAEKNGDRLFDSRYHMFIRATESVFITLPPSGKLFLTRKYSHYDNGKDFKVFEIATCSHCHDIYLVGNVNKDTNCLDQYAYNNEDQIKDLFLLGDKISDLDEDYTLEDENIEAEEYEICARCGYLVRPGTIEEHRCEHGKKYYIKVYKVKVKTETKTLTKCLSCENVNSFGILRMFFSGQEAVTSVIATALFEELPSYKLEKIISEIDDDTGFSSGFESSSIAIQETKTNIAKQFIAFSDSRQAAAFFSSYLDQTYRNILYKRLIIETLEDDRYTKRGKTLNTFVNDLAFKLEKHDIASNNIDIREKEAWKAALRELVDNRGSTSLYSMGLIGIGIDTQNIQGNNKLGLTSDEVSDICNIFALWMMSDSAISYDANLTKADREYFSHNGIEFSYTLSDSDNKAYRLSFIPSSENRSNKRLDYLTKIMKKNGKENLVSEGSRFLTGFWNHLFASNSLELMVSDGGKYKLNGEKIIISKKDKWYFCPSCKKITMYNVKNVCPSFRCEGTLEQIDIAEYYADNHYYQIYQNLDIRDLRIVEHTAQLDKETAYEYQRMFKTKEIDILSCSTTFEMGVDVGSLETVFMRNMPPSPANYAQRAGRAGRSKKSAAYAITFCNKSNHDFTFFKKPENMIRGKIDPPRFNVENEKIAIRHLYASALSYFWKKYPTYFKNAGTMIDEDENQVSGYNLFIDYLNEKPNNLLLYLKEFLPTALHDKFNINSFGWLENLTGEEGVFTKAIAEYNYEINILEEAKNDSLKSDGRDVSRLLQRIRVYKSEDILAFLSRKNVLPKYGFPVDTVEMNIVDRSNKFRLGLQLQRDLSMAISEYAPDSQIVANGNLITSRYIRKIPNMNWKQFNYIICDCKTLNIHVHTTDHNVSDLGNCKQCGKSLEVSKRKTFLVPAFGFEADGDKISKPGLKKPERTFSSDAYYVGYREEVKVNKFQIGSSQIELGISTGDEMAILNESNFYVCESCGYSELMEKEFTRIKRKKHNKPNGYSCKNDGSNILKRFSLGYRYETDVVQLRFVSPDLIEYDKALSVLYGVILGVCSYLNIEQRDISGCLQYFYNTDTHRPNYSIILYDKTPGGAGHVRRLNDAKVLEGVLNETFNMMNNCDCGGEAKDTSCYSCIRNYYNQKYHDILQRGYVIDFIKGVLFG